MSEYETEPNFVIRTHDDKKGRWQSHEVHVTFKDLYIEISSYGEDPRDAANEMIAKLKRHIGYVEEACAELRLIVGETVPEPDAG